MWLTEAYYEKMLKLIKCVQNRPSLWNTAHDNYYNRCLSRHLWSEIEDECDMEPGSAAKRWKNMKDTYRKEIRKGLKHSTWLYTKHMAFLQNILGAPNVNNKRMPFLEEHEQSIDGQNSTEAVVIECSAEDSNQIQNKTETKTVNAREFGQQTVKLNSNNFIENLIDDSKDNNDDDDDDYHFLMSCRHYLKEMSEQKKLKFRMEMEQLMLDFLYNDEN